MDRNQDEAGIRCYLHIGAPKTGTTALQQFLSANRSRLSALGYLYPESTLRAHGHHDIAFLSGPGYPDWATPQPRSLDELVSDLREEISAVAQRIILSSENFYLMQQPENVRRLLNSLGFTCNGDVRIIVYVRRQDEMHLSWYNQAVKAQGFSGQLDDCIEMTREWWNYASQLERWGEVFGSCSLIVRPYQSADLSGGDIRRDFCATIGLNCSSLEFTDHRPNSGLNRSLLEFQRLLNQLPLPVQEKRGLHRQLIDLSAATAGSGLFEESSLLSPEKRKALIDYYAKYNNEVARTYLSRDQLFSDELPPTSRQDGMPFSLTPEDVIQVVGWLLLKQSSSHQKTSPNE